MPATVSKEKNDWLTPVVVVGSGLGIGFGVYYLMQKKPKTNEPSNLRITNYTNLRTSISVKPAALLSAQRGDTIRVGFEFDYVGQAITGTYHVAFYVQQLGVNEVGTPSNVSFSIPESGSSRTIKGTADITVGGIDMPERVNYGLYVKIAGIPGKNYDVRLASVIRVIPKESVRNLQIFSYDSRVSVGGSCAVQVTFEYQGAETRKTLRAAIGTERGWPIGFDEICFADTPLVIPESPAWSTWSFTIFIPIKNISAGIYDLYAKLDGLGVPWAESPHLQDVITVEWTVPPVPPVPPAGYILTMSSEPPYIGANLTRSPNKTAYQPNEWVEIETPDFLPPRLGENILGYSFLTWLLNGEPYPLRRAAVIMTRDIRAVAVYQTAQVLPPIPPTPPPQPGKWNFSMATLPQGTGELRAQPEPTNGMYADGTVVTLTAIPYGTEYFGYRFDHWEISQNGGTVLNFQNPLVLTIKANVWVGMVFKPIV